MLTKKHARVLKRQISRLYGRSYIPVINPNNVLSIGDILIKKRDVVPIINSSAFDPSKVKFEEGRKLNTNITSNTGVNVTIKLKGTSILSEHFKANEAGLVVNFSGSNQMFLKVMGLRQQSIRNFLPLRNELLTKYTIAELSPKIYIVRGLVYADKFYLQYSSTNGGSIAFNLDAKSNVSATSVDSDFSLKWIKEVGYNIDGLNGGVLAYRVSGLRLNRHLMPTSIHRDILNGNSEEDILDMISLKERKKLFEKNALEIVDLTDELALYNLNTEENTVLS